MRELDDELGYVESWLRDHREAAQRRTCTGWRRGLAGDVIGDRSVGGNAGVFRVHCEGHRQMRLGEALSRSMKCQGNALWVSPIVHNKEASAGWGGYARGGGLG